MPKEKEARSGERSVCHPGGAVTLSSSGTGQGMGLLGEWGHGRPSTTNWASLYQAQVGVEHK